MDYARALSEPAFHRRPAAEPAGARSTAQAKVDLRRQGLTWSAPAQLAQDPDAVAQRVSPEDELQRKADPSAVAQRVGPEEDELQRKADPAAPPLAQRQADPTTPSPIVTGLPDRLKSGVETLSGLSLDNVRVHYNSSQPAQLSALAYAQGTDIHVAPGQEHHLPHEAWHVVQQAEGRVQPTLQMQDGSQINDQPALEHEADIMGEKALSLRT